MKQKFIIGVDGEKLLIEAVRLCLNAGWLEIFDGNECHSNSKMIACFQKWDYFIIEEKNETQST